MIEDRKINKNKKEILAAVQVGNVKLCDLFIYDIESIIH
jgi:hypothetical protein